jgi:hypothetical protein
MKAIYHVCVLLYATIGLGFPIQILFTDGTPTIRAGNKAIADSQKEITAEKPVIQERPSFREVPTVSVGDGPDSESDSTKPKPTSPVSSPGRYGTFLGKLISNDDHIEKDGPARSRSPSRAYADSTRQTISYLRAADLLDILEKHGPECIALGLFVLVPIAYFVLELLELAVKSCTREQFPRRGRDRVRLVGPERQLRAWSNRHREMKVESEKYWWQTKRARY